MFFDNTAIYPIIHFLDRSWEGGTVPTEEKVPYGIKDNPHICDPL